MTVQGLTVMMVNPSAAHPVPVEQGGGHCAEYMIQNTQYPMHLTVKAR